MMTCTSRRHHYVPQFYLRQFACVDDRNKVFVVEQHRKTLIADRKSIASIAYEDFLYDFTDGNGKGSIERDLNLSIETPFSRGVTWTKIASGAADKLDVTDKMAIYGFARHLQNRSLEMLRFIETENARFQTGELDGDLTAEEREMHAWIADSADGAHAIFRHGALDTSLPPDVRTINVIVCQSPIALRTTTCPTVPISHSGCQSAFGPLFDSLNTWWLTLGRTCGAFIVSGGPAGFSNILMPLDTARMVNRQYLVQHQNSSWVRYLIAQDDFLKTDLEWAGFKFERKTTHGFRYRRSAS